jgi:hypothetical protein
MSYNPNERIRMLMALNLAFARVAALGTADERPTYDHARAVCADYLRAHDIYMREVEPVRNVRVECGPTISEFGSEA